MPKIKSIKSLAMAIAKKEGKKVQVNIAQINEIIGILSDLTYSKKLGDIWFSLYRNGYKRAKKKAKSCRK